MIPTPWTPSSYGALVRVHDGVGKKAPKSEVGGAADSSSHRLQESVKRVPKARSATKAYINNMAIIAAVARTHATAAVLDHLVCPANEIETMLPKEVLDDVGTEREGDSSGRHGTRRRQHPQKKHRLSSLHAPTGRIGQLGRSSMRGRSRGAPRQRRHPRIGVAPHPRTLQAAAVPDDCARLRCATLVDAHPACASAHASKPPLAQSARTI